MASTVPAKSQPLHNFNGIYLKWTKDGDSSSQHQRRRTMKSPSRRPNPSVTSPLPQSPLRDSVQAASSSRRQSPSRDSPLPPPPSRASPAPEDYSVKQSPIRGESSKSSPVRERVKLPPIGVDSLNQPAFNGESGYHWPKRDSASESEALGKREGPLIEYRRNHSKHSAAESSKNGGNSKNPEQKFGEKIGQKPKATEVDASISKRSKILIKIPCKNNKQEMENQTESQKAENNKDEGDETDETQQEQKLLCSLDDEGKTWNLRPRKPIRKSLNVNGGGAKTNGCAVKTNGGSGKSSAYAAAEKNKAPSPSKNVGNKAGETEANGGGSGVCEKKEKKRLRLFISLTKEEIEEDIYSMTGGKPSRRPKKRAKNVQKQLDFAFPGLWLQGMTPESYKC